MKRSFPEVFMNLIRAISLFIEMLCTGNFDPAKYLEALNSLNEYSDYVLDDDDDDE